MARPLQALLALKERLLGVAQMHLRDTQAQLQRVGEALAQGFGSKNQVRAAADLNSDQALRDLAQAHEDALKLRLVEQTHALGQAKRELRQIEMLVQKQAERARALAARRESADVDDWYRSQQGQNK